MRFSGTSNSDSLDFYAINSTQNINFSYSVGTRKPNASGLYDMSGNVQEWIGQYYQFYEMPRNQHNLYENSLRVMRGEVIGKVEISLLPTGVLALWQVHNLKMWVFAVQLAKEN